MVVWSLILQLITRVRLIVRNNVITDNSAVVIIIIIMLTVHL